MKSLYLRDPLEDVIDLTLEQSLPCRDPGGEEILRPIPRSTALGLAEILRAIFKSFFGKELLSQIKTLKMKLYF